MQADARKGKLPALLLFALLGVIWGSNFIYMKLAAEYISPGQTVFWRVLFGALPVAVYAALKGHLRLAHFKHVWHFVVMSLIATLIYYYCFAAGAARLYSGIAGALSGVIPLFSFALSLLFLPGEGWSAARAFGLALGAIGVVIISKPFAAVIGGEAVELSGVLFMLGGALSVGASFVYAKKFLTPLKISAAALTTYQLAFAAFFLLLFVDLGGAGDVFQSAHVGLGVAVGLGVLGTGAAYIIYYYLIDALGAVNAAAVTYIPPFVALLIGALFAGEKILISDYFAAGLVLAGVMLLRRKNDG